MVTRQKARPDDLDLDSPGRRDYWVMLEHDSIWGQHLIPLTVWVGPAVEPGKGLVAFGSNHGNEYEGPVAIKRLLHEFDIAHVTGRIILIPVLNVEAFRTGTRESVEADGVNLNRAFVDQAGRSPALGGITHRIVDFVRQHIWPRVHVVLDIHSGGQVARFALCTSHHAIEDSEQARVIEETAAWFGTPFIITYWDNTPGLLPSEAEKLGKITIGTELGWGEAVNHEGVRYAMHGIRAAAINHLQMSGPISPIAHHKDRTQKHVTIADPDCVVFAPLGGHYEEIIPCGSKVKKGDIVGRIHDFERVDECALDIKATCDGFVIAQAWAARIKQGQNILCVGKPT